MSMADDRLSLPDETDSQSGALLPVNALPHGNGEWNGIAVKEPAAEPAGPDLIDLPSCHAGGIGCWRWGSACCARRSPAPRCIFGIGERYTAYSVLRVSMQEKQMLSERQRGRGGPRSF